jgi:hypothetical protein
MAGNAAAAEYLVRRIMQARVHTDGADRPPSGSPADVVRGSKRRTGGYDAFSHEDVITFNIFRITLSALAHVDRGYS